MNSEKDKMLAGELYDAGDAQLVSERLLARQRCFAINNSDPADDALRRRLLGELFASGGETVCVEPPFRCDYGTNIHLGENVYFNFECVILDVCEVRIGDHCFFAPGVQIYTATHPLEAKRRRTHEFGIPVAIGNDVWIGGKAVICPGVTIGERSVIGVGSVVTKNIPSGVLAVGNPARVVREIEPSDPSQK